MAKIRGMVKFLLSILMGIVIGGFAGVVGYNALVSYRIDEYLEEIHYLRTVIEDKDTRLQKLEESINKQKVILKEIQIELVFAEEEEGDKIDTLTVEKAIKERYSNLIGKEVKTIDIDMIEAVIDTRIMRTESSEYRLKVAKIILTDVLYIQVKTELSE